MRRSPARVLVETRLRSAGLIVGDGQLDQLAAYLDVLARWNARMNLTSFDLASPGDAAIDRLIVEPVCGAPSVPASASTLVDVGSGGGSPAIPLKIMRPDLHAVLVEARARKAAFLREAGRQLGLHSFEVASETFSEFASRTFLTGRVDAVSVRAVRVDTALWRGIGSILSEAGVLLWFGCVGDLTNIDGFYVAQVTPPVVQIRRNAPSS